MLLTQKQMKLYGLFYKDKNEPINQIRFKSLEEAKLFFAQQKRSLHLNSNFQNLKYFLISMFIDFF